MSDNSHNSMLLQLDHVSKIYGDLHALDDLSLEVSRGQWLAVVGSSGSGKTTLMNIIGCLDQASRGSVILDGQSLDDLHQSQLADVRKNVIGLVFQKFYLVPHLTAVENVMVAQYYHSVVDERQALDALAKVGLADRAHHLPKELSGGEQQRVCIARALINDPELILADEPTGNLDEANEKIVLQLFRELNEQGTTIIVVTHDALVASCAQREIMLNHGQLVGEKWNDDQAHQRFLDAGGHPALHGSDEVSAPALNPTKASKVNPLSSESVQPLNSGKDLPKKKNLTRRIAAGALSLVATVGLAGCGTSSAVPADDEYAGTSESSSAPSSSDSSSASSGSSGRASKPTASAGNRQKLGPDTGTYANGRFTSIATYGPVGEDKIDVAITVSGQKVSQVTVTPHPATPISKKYQTGFVKEIKSAIVGKPLKNLKVSKVAGASWTSDAFNKALEVVRQEASTAAGRH